MIRFTQINKDIDAGLLSKFSKAAMSSGLSVFELFYDGISFFKYIPEDNFYQEIY